MYSSKKLLSNLLGISQSSAYELMHNIDFPTIKIGNRMVVPKEELLEWIKRNANDGR